jgi:hypothetical protein
MQDNGSRLVKIQAGTPVTWPSALTPRVLSLDFLAEAAPVTAIALDVSEAQAMRHCHLLGPALLPPQQVVEQMAVAPVETPVH